MFKLRLLLPLLLALLLGACNSAPEKPVTETPGWMPMARLLPNGARIGIINLIDNKLIHVHAGSTALTNSRKEYNGQFDFGTFTVQNLRTAILTKTPYQVQQVAPSGKLLAARNTWQDTWDGQTFAPEFQREFDAVLKQNQLRMLIIIAAPEGSDGVFGTGQKLLGSGLYTRSFFGSHKAAAYTNIQFYRVIGLPSQLLSPVEAPGDRKYAELPGYKLPDDMDNFDGRNLTATLDPIKQLILLKIKNVLGLLL